MKLTEAAFLHRLSYAARVAELNRLVGRCLREAIERAQLPLPPIGNLGHPERWDAELADNPIFIAVDEMSLNAHPLPDFYRALAFAKDAWNHYEKLPDPVPSAHIRVK